MSCSRLCNWCSIAGFVCVCVFPVNYFSALSFFTRNTGSAQVVLLLLLRNTGRYLDGADGWAQDLQSGSVTAVCSSATVAKFRELVLEISDPVRNEGKHWGAVRTAVLLLATYMASIPPSAYALEMTTEQLRG